MNQTTASAYPQILYWKWDDRILEGDRLEVHLEAIFRRSNFNTLYVSFHWMEKPFDNPSLQVIIARCAHWLAARGKRFCLDIDARDACRAFLNDHPEEAAWFIEYVKLDLDGRGRAERILPPRKKLRWGQERLDGPEKIVAAVAARALGDRNYAAGSLSDISQCTTITPLEGNQTKLLVDAGVACAGFSAYLFLGHRHVLPDFFSPRLNSYVESMFALVQHLPLGGAGTDEWGYSLSVWWDQQMQCDLLPWSPGMSRAFQTRHDQSLESQLHHLYLSPENTDAPRLALINRYIALLRDQMSANEQSFYEITKRKLGEDALVLAHPTWIGGKSEFQIETLYNGLNWWQVKRDFAQTDEFVIIPLRLALARKAGGVVWYNMWYSPGPTQNIESFYKETWENARWGGRTHQLGYECPKEGILEFAPEGRLENIWSMESVISRLNAFQKAQPNSRILVVFGFEAATNWALSAEQYPPWGERHQGMKACLNLAQEIFTAGFLCDVVPTSEIANGSLRLRAGLPCYGDHDYDALVLVAPECLDPRSLRWLTEVFASGLPCLLVGTGSALSDGTDGGKALAALLAAAPDHLALNPDIGTVTAWINRHRIPANRFDNGCMLTDGSALFAAEGLKPTGNELHVDAHVAGHRVQFSGEDFLGIQLAADGSVQRFSAGKAFLLQINDVEQNLSSIPGTSFASPGRFHSGSAI